MAIVTAFGRSLDNIMKSLIIVGLPIYARTIRGSILSVSVREEDFEQAGERKLPLPSSGGALRQGDRQPVKKKK